MDKIGWTSLEEVLMRLGEGFGMDGGRVMYADERWRAGQNRKVVDYAGLLSEADV